jgi:hypothetical protein
MKKLNINIEEVDKCVRSSFVRDDQTGQIVDNKLLKEDRFWS